MNTFWQVWNTFNSLWSLAALCGMIIVRIIVRTAAYGRWKLRRDTAQLFYKHRSIFVDSDLTYSVPAYLRNGAHHSEGMTLREWSYFAMQKPGFLRARDWMEYISILNTSRRLIEQTYAEQQDHRHLKDYDQLSSHFDRLCASLNDMRSSHRDCPIQFKQAYLPAVPLPERMQMRPELVRTR